MEDLINNVRMLYDYHGPEERAVSPPLPSPPSQEEDSPLIGALNSRNNVPVYGSSHTVIKTVPPQGTNPASALSTTSEIAPKLPPRTNRQPRRATISSGSAADPPSSTVPNLSGPSPSRPSEDGRATGYSRPPPSPGSIAAATASSTSKQQPRLELKTRSADTSATSSPVKERENRTGAGTGTATSYSAPSSKNTSDIALMPVQAVASGSGGDSALSLLTTLNTTKRPSYADSLLREPAVLMSQGLSDDNPEEPEEVDYPGSPDTSALEFRTAVNTPEAEEPPYTLDGL
jgi:hypothetical protein